MYLRFDQTGDQIVNQCINSTAGSFVKYHNLNAKDSLVDITNKVKISMLLIISTEIAFLDIN